MFATTLVAASFALLASAAPMKRAGPTDVEILNYALTLEHLESAFYTGALAKYSEKDFEAAGFEPWVRGRFNQIKNHESTHVSFLATALGAAATKPCEYSFPYTDPKSFVALSTVLENGGVSAYLGAAGSITNKNYLTVAASILTTEARHQGWVSSAVAKSSAWSGAFDVPLDFDQIYSIVAPFITSCPATNPKLPVVAFASASYTPAAPAAGSEITVKFTAGKTKGPYYLAVYTGLTVSYAPISSSGKVTLPAGLQGTVFGVVTTSATAITDANTVSAPLIFDFAFDSYAAN